MNALSERPSTERGRNKVVTRPRRGAERNAKTKGRGCASRLDRRERLPVYPIHMYPSLFEVSQWCDAADLLGRKKKITYISRFGEIISGSRRMERNIPYLIPKYSYSTYPNPLSEWSITCWDNIKLIHGLHGEHRLLSC